MKRHLFAYLSTLLVIIPFLGYGQCSNQITVAYYNNGVATSQTVNNGQNGFSAAVCPTAGAQYTFNGSSTAGAVLTWSKVITKDATNSANDVVQVISSGSKPANTALSATVSFTTATIYRLESNAKAYTGSNCNKVDYVYLTITPSLTLASNAPLNGVCAGSSVTLTSSGSSNGTYTWAADGVTIAGQTGSSLAVMPTATTTYTVTAPTSCGTSSQQIVVTVKSLSVSPSAPTVCANQATSLTASYSGTSATYQWFVKGTTTPMASGATVSVRPTATTTYQVVATTSDCSTLAKEVTVTIGTPTVSVSPNAATTCSGAGVTLVATSNNPNATYAWSPSTGLNTTSGATVIANPTVNTTYTVTVTVTTTTTTASCGPVSSSVPVTVAAATYAVTPSAVTTCPNAITTLTASSNITSATYAWYLTSDLGTIISTSPTLSVSPAATTTYRVLTSTPCSPTSNSQDVTVTVTTAAAPSVSASAGQSTINRGSSTSLTASGADTYSWSPATGLSSTTGATVTASPSMTTTYTVTGTTAAGCSNTSQVTLNVINPQPLPVGLTQFTGSRVAGRMAVALTWATASEQNNRYFAVERSADGLAFAKLAQVDGMGNSTVAHTYSYTDEHALMGAIYYRLRQVDFDGNAAYSPVVIIAAQTATSEWLVPTAAGHYLLQGELVAGSRFAVLDVLGRAVYTQAVDAAHAEIALPALPTGVYLFQLTTSHGRYTVRQALTSAN